MKVLGIKLQKAGLIMMSIAGIIVGMSGCEDRFDTPRPPMPEGKSVDVSLCVGIADGVDATPTKGTSTDALATAIPDQLYNLQILQYDSNKNFKKLVTVGGNQAIGSTLNVTLAACDNCHLILVARGATGAIPAFSGSPSWSDLQGRLADYNTIDGLTEINNMPYFLHLPNVNVTNDGKVIESALGEDARILLKRLAVRLTVNWVFGGGSGNTLRDSYTLKEVKLCQVPSAYYLMPQTESDSRFEGDLYPSSLLEYKDPFRLKGDKAVNEGSLKTWMPANAKGKSSQVTSEYYRTKEYAHSAATYMEFVVDSKDGSERLYYRSYLGGKDVSDFNLLENTNYVWTVNIQNADYRTDPRIRLLDQAPVISNNLVPTSNCFMMRPGTNICFNPYKHEAGTDGENTYLSGKTIGSVCVLWQNKDAGTSGDLVMGYAVSNESSSYNHTNLVNYTDIADRTKARVHVKVPVTKGGNAVIAAYSGANGTGDILWSWHIWVTDYVPVPLSGDITSVNREVAINAAQNATQGGMVHVYGGISWVDPNGSFYKCVIMDRNLGATKGGLQQNTMDWVRTFGLLYQGGRKDPFFGTPDGGTDETRTIYDGSGYTKELVKSGSSASLDATIKNPLVFYKTLSSSDWNGDGAKTIYDPCPKGWRVPSNEYLNNGASAGLNSSFNRQTADSKASMCAGFGQTANDYVCEWDCNKKNSDNLMYYNGSGFISLIGKGEESTADASRGKTDDFKGSAGAGYLYFGGSGENQSNWTNKSAFFPTAILRETNGDFRVNTNNKLFIWSSSKNKRSGGMQMYEFQSALLSFQHANATSFGFSVRCIQDNIKDRSYSDCSTGK